MHSIDGLEKTLSVGDVQSIFWSRAVMCGDVQYSGRPLNWVSFSSHYSGYTLFHQISNPNPS